MEHTARRVVTGHDEDGRSIIASDERLEGIDFGPANIIRVWATSGFPSDNRAPGDGSALIETVASADGTATHIVDWAPHQEFPLHRSHTIDYLVVLSGRLTLEVDSGQATVLVPGDVVVQRGTNHVWRNDEDEWCRTLVTLVAAEPVEIGGEAAPATLL